MLGGADGALGAQSRGPVSGGAMPCQPEPRWRLAPDKCSPDTKPIQARAGSRCRSAGSPATRPPAPWRQSTDTAHGPMKLLFPSLRVVACFFAVAASLLSNAVAFDISGTVWVNEGTELPGSCMIFEPNGTLRFKGGFLYYNPSRWSKVDVDPELIRIHLGGKAAFPAAVARQQLERDPNGSLASYDPKHRLLVYRIGFGNVPIQFNGFVFTPKANCAGA